MKVNIIAYNMVYAKLQNKYETRTLTLQLFYRQASKKRIKLSKYKSTQYKIKLKTIGVR